MEQPSRRNKFIKKLLPDVYINMTLTDEIRQRLFDDDHNPCKELMDSLEKVKDRSAQKMFILLEYTKEREPVEYLAKILIDHDQRAVAEDLHKFNRSEELIDYVTNEYLPVRNADILRSGGSCRFEMEAAPRGLLVILLNELKLEPQAKQIASVFSQMFFNIRLEHLKTCVEIQKIFTEVAKNVKYNDFKSLVTIVIGHGANGSIEGSGYSKGNIKDTVPIAHLIDIFSEDKCVNFRDKPKINIFDCCRNRDYDNKGKSQINSTLLDKIKCFNKEWTNKNINTTVVYSCAEGDKAYFIENSGFSFFGRALTHTIAQYACEKDLDGLIKMINRRLGEDGIKQYPEVIHFMSRWALFFNPGRIKIIQ